jgi:hypothetical protein
MNNLRRANRLWRSTASQLAEKSTALEEHGFTACGKKHCCEGARLHSLRKKALLWRSTASQLAEKSTALEEHGFTACGKSTALKGHGFSRAESICKFAGL